MKTPPQISVVLSVFNGAATVREAVESILGQTFSDFELVVLDDGSTDASRDILRGYERQDDRVRLLLNERNLGLPASLNRGVALASALVIARQDSDDVSHPERLALQLAALEDSGLAVLGTNHALIDALGRPFCRSCVECASLREAAEHGLCIFAHGSAMFRKEVFARLGGYDERFFYTQDLDLWWRFSAAGHGIGFLNQDLYFLRMGPGWDNPFKAGFQRRYSEIVRRRHALGEDVETDLERTLSELLAARQSGPGGPVPLAGARYWCSVAAHAAEDKNIPAMLRGIRKALAAGGPDAAKGILVALYHLCFRSRQRLAAAPGAVLRIG